MGVTHPSLIILCYVQDMCRERADRTFFSFGERLDPRLMGLCPGLGRLGLPFDLQFRWTLYWRLLSTAISIQQNHWRYIKTTYQFYMVCLGEILFHVSMEIAAVNLCGIFCPHNLSSIAALSKAHLYSHSMAGTSIHE